MSEPSTIRTSDGQAPVMHVGMTALRADPGTWVVAFNGVLLVCLFAWVPFHWGGEAHVALIGDLADVVIGLSLVGMTWRASRSAGMEPSTRCGWRLIALGCFSYWIGNVIWFNYEILLGINPFPSLADFGYLGFFPLVLAGVMCFIRPMESRTERTLFWLDLCVIAIGAGTLVWYFLLRPIVQTNHDGALTLILAQIYPISDTVFLVGVMGLVLRWRRDRPAAPIAWLVAGLLSFLLTDIRFTYETAQKAYVSGGFTNAMYYLSYMLMMVGAHLEYRGGAQAIPPKAMLSRPEWGMGLLPYLSVAAVYGPLLPVALGWSSEAEYGSRGGTLSGLLLAAVTLAILVMVRQSVAAQEIARLRAEQVVQQTEARFASLVRHSSDVISLLGPDLRLRFVSPAIQRVLGLAPRTLTDQPLFDLLHPEDQPNFTSFIERVLATQEVPAVTEWRLRHADGSWRDIEILATNLTEDPTVGGVVLNSRDVTDRKRYERDIHQARDAAEAANRAKSEFLANMSHEIRTPMNVVLGLAQVLGRESLAANQRDMVRHIQAAGQSLLAIINDILDFSKIEAGQLRPESHPFDLGTLLAKLDSLMGYQARTKGITLSTAAPTASLGLLLGDALRVEQVLINLMGNAIKFTERGEVSVQVQPLETSESAVRLRFTVRDTGIGITPEALASLFTPFTQADGSITRRFGGTGLGLSISKRLVELMGGTIGAESHIGQGSYFWFELPFARAAGSAADVSTSPTPALLAGPRLTGRHVLVVDDSAMNRDVVERALGIEGATATPVADGQQALQLLQTQPDAFDAVLMDVQMPVMDGLTATQRIRHELGLTNLPILVFTAGVLMEQQQAARAAGANDVLAKPVDLEQMVAMLLRWVPTPCSPAGKEVGTKAEDSATFLHLPDPIRKRCELVDDFPDIPGIDRARVAQPLGQDHAFFLRMLTQFTTEFADIVAQTQHDLAAGDRETATRRLHTLRGNAGYLGMPELMITAGELEETLRRGEMDLAAGLEILGRQLDALNTASAPWRETAAAVMLPCPGPPLKVESTTALLEALRNYDLKALRRFEELEPALRGTLGAPETEMLGKTIRGLRFEDALAWLERRITNVGIDPAHFTPIRGTTTNPSFSVDAGVNREHRESISSPDMADHFP